MNFSSSTLKIPLWRVGYDVLISVIEEDDFEDRRFSSCGVFLKSGIGKILVLDFLRFHGIRLVRFGTLSGKLKSPQVVYLWMYFSKYRAR